VVDELLDLGTAPVVVLLDVIGPAQRRVGERWQRGEWTVAQEHAATAIAHAAATVTARRIEQPPVSLGHVVVACAEREWHALPALMVAETIRFFGWQVTYLGAATPAGRLAQYLDDLGPDAVALSCSVISALPSSRRVIEAARQSGVPVLAGGSAFGPDALRALVLGATAWAGNAQDAVTALADLSPVVDPADPLPADVATEQAELDLRHSELVRATLTRWAAADTTGAVAGDLAAVAEDAVHQALHSLGAALLTGDTRILREAADWVPAVVTGRGGTRALADGLPVALSAELVRFPLAAPLLRDNWTATA
jgi:methanogenic corrinoid protein MtbC1